MKKQFYLKFLFIIYFLIYHYEVRSQTNPAAQAISYSQNFLSLVSTYPAGWQGWKIGAAASSTFVVTPGTADRQIITPTPSTAATIASGIHNFNQKIGILSDTSDVALVLAINTLSKTGITMVFDIMTIRNVQDGSNNRINQVDLQYRVGTAGNFTSVTGNTNGIYQNNSVNQVIGSTGQNIVTLSFALPAACNNQSNVQLRFVQRDFSGIGSRPSFAIDNVCINNVAPAVTITGNSIYCGGTARFVANVTNIGTIPVYSWRRNNTTIGTNSNTLDFSSFVVGDTVRCIFSTNTTCLAATSNFIRINSTATPPSVTGSVMHTTCGSNNNGSITLSPSGGLAPYTYCWDTTNTVNGALFAVTVGAKTAAHPYFNLGTLGNSAAFITDNTEAKRLKLTRGINYIINVLGAHPYNIAYDSVGQNAFNIANGQTGAPTGTGTVNFRPNSTHPNSIYYTCQAHSYMGFKIDLQSFCLTTPTISNRKPGTYTVITTDANGCTAQNQFTINSSTNNLAVNATTSPASCNGANGSINATVTGGTAPYTLCWDTINRTNGAQFGVTAGTKTAAHPYFGIGSATGYIIDGVEGKQITLAKNITYSFNIFSPGHPWFVSTDSVGGNTAGIVINGQTNAPIDNGLVKFRPDNSHPSLLRYACSFHPYMGYKINIANSFCVEDPTGLPAGTYTVNVTDANNCTTSANFTVGSTAAFNAVLSSTTNVSCYGKADGAVNFTPSGGIPPYSVTGTGPTFAVISEVKNHSHPQFGAGSANGYTIDGKQGKELTLIRGITYSFSVFTPGHPFFISTSLVGGPGNLGSEVTNGVTNSMTVNGTLTFTPNATHPQLLYYQCAAHNNMGWKINIVDQLGAGDLDSCMAGNYSISVIDGSGCATSPFNIVIGEPAGFIFYYDNDTDSYGGNTESTIACTVPLGWVSTSTDCNDNDSTIHPGAMELCGNGIDEDCDFLIDDGCDTILTLKVFIEGYYEGNETMRPVITNSGGLNPLLCDTVIVELHDTVAPYNKLSADTVVVGVNGFTSIRIKTSFSSQAFYIVIRGRNIIETWSKNPVIMGISTYYDFSSGSSNRPSLILKGKPEEH